MRTRLLLTAMMLTAAAASVSADDELFSRIRLDPTSAEDVPPQPPGSNQERQQTGIGGLQGLLLAAGYTSRIAGEDAVVIEVFEGDWSATVGLVIAEGGREIRVAMKLTDPEKDTVIAPSTLRAMLEANRRNWGAFFAVAGDPQHIELVKTLPQQNLDAEALRDSLTAMVETAQKTKSVWNVDGLRVQQSQNVSAETTPATTPTAAASPEVKPATTTPATTTPATTPAAAEGSSLTGKWISTPNTNEAFALQLDEAGTFRLVHVKGSNSTKSNGSYTLSGSDLTLKGDDATINGRLTRTSDGFTLALIKGGKATVTLTFKKAS